MCVCGGIRNTVTLINFSFWKVGCSVRTLRRLLGRTLWFGHMPQQADAQRVQREDNKAQERQLHRSNSQPLRMDERTV